MRFSTLGRQRTFIADHLKLERTCRCAKGVTLIKVHVPGRAYRPTAEKKDPLPPLRAHEGTQHRGHGTQSVHEGYAPSSKGDPLGLA